MNNKEINLNFYPRDPELEEQIKGFFNISKEQQFSERLRGQGINERQIAFYRREQVLKFLLEFAAGVKKTQVIYELDDNGQVIYPDIDLNMEEMLYEAAQTQAYYGDNQRELAELEGWQKMQQLFHQEEAASVLQLSPPCITNSNHGNYGFLFWFARQGKRVVNHILRYDEDRSTLKGSFDIAKSLGMNATTNQSLDNSLLKNPKSFQADTKTIKTLLGSLGLFFDNRGSLLEQALLTDRDFVLLLRQYEAQVNMPIFSFYQKAKALEIMSQLYQLTQDKATQIGLLDKRPQEQLIPLIYFGGSCPTIGRNGFGFYDYAAYLFGEPFTCPNCGYVSYVPVGDKCPDCKITKQEWKKKKEAETGDSFNVCD